LKSGCQPADRAWLVHQARQFVATGANPWIEGPKRTQSLGEPFYVILNFDRQPVPRGLKSQKNAVKIDRVLKLCFVRNY
ncbi:MAG: hypothetical protein AAF939_08520, partial [Planctomycetota bacterium]